jgi:hypothetical protein
VTPKRKRPKPAPKLQPIAMVQGRDYYCGTCTGHGSVFCDYCVDGCPECEHTGRVRCPTCLGGTVPVPPPSLG